MKINQLTKKSLTAKINIGSRNSKLAMIQTAEFISKITTVFPETNCKIFPISTLGDQITDRPLYDIGGKALFITELEEAIVNKKIDVAIHSAKDLMPIINNQTEIVAVLPRGDTQDCLVSNLYSTIESIPDNAIIGTCSPRRKAILQNIARSLNRNWKILPLRGNIETRIKKLDDGEYHAIILATCALKRLNLTSRITKILSHEQFLPAGGQGFLVAQGSINNIEVNKIFNQINNNQAKLQLLAERSFLKNLGASCFSPVAVYANVENQKLQLEARIYDINGQDFYVNKLECSFDFTSLNTDFQIGINLGLELAINFQQNAPELLKKIGCKY